MWFLKGGVSVTVFLDEQVNMASSIAYAFGYNMPLYSVTDTWVMDYAEAKYVVRGASWRL